MVEVRLLVHFRLAFGLISVVEYGTRCDDDVERGYHK